jgi:hypothetical protein
MPANRFQFSDDFVLNANKVGINSSTPQEELDVVGVVKADNLKVTGVSSFTSYEGFLNSNHNITENTTLTSGTSGSLSGEIIVGTGITLSGISSTTSGQGHIDSLKVYNTLTIPVGGTLERPSKAKPGQLYYNKDFATIEFYTGEVWRQVDNTTRSGRGVFGGGGTPTFQSTIEFINTSSLGNSTNFGSLATARTGAMGCSSSIRGIFGGGTATLTNIEYITLASQGNGISFGSLSLGKEYGSGLSSSSRGIFGAGQSAPVQALTNVIDYVTISTLGNALDFGDLINAMSDCNSCASPTRGIFGGGYTGPGGMGRISTIQSLTISSTGNTVKFGDLTDRRSTLGACSNSVRGMFGGGAVSGAPDNKLVVIDYVTIASFGNSVNFGDLTQRRVQLGSLASQTRGFWAGGYATAPIADFLNIIDYVTIATTGNAQDFGDLTKKKNYPTGLSDSHGGLGGF